MSKAKTIDVKILDKELRIACAEEEQKELLEAVDFLDKRMRHIRAIDTTNDTMTVEAGCILKDIQTAATDADRLFPLSLGAEGSCAHADTVVALFAGHGEYSSASIAWNHGEIQKSH